MLQPLNTFQTPKLDLELRSSNTDVKESSQVISLYIHMQVASAASLLTAWNRLSETTVRINE